MKIIGHRGAAGLAPENTLEAATAGLKAGADEIEIDVRVTSDGVAVLHHDPYISVGKNKKAIAEHTLGELRAYKSDLATLEDTIRLVSRQIPLIVEVKPKVHTEVIVQTLQEFLKLSWQPTDFSLASFSQPTLLSLHKALPDIPTIVIERFSGLRAAHRARQLNTLRISMNHHNMWWGFIRRMHRAGFQLNAYTLNDQKKAKRWAKHGLYGVITDFPNRRFKNGKTKG